MLYGSGEQPRDSHYRFFNTFGKDFGGEFDQTRIKDMEPDYPIDMNFYQEMSDDLQYKNQEKCPQARFLFNDRRSFEICVKLVIQNVKNSNQYTEKNQIMKILKFIMIDFMNIKNFEQLEFQSDNIQPLTIEIVEVLLNSAMYYQKKYDGELEHMQEVFTADGLSTKQHSPLKADLL